MPASSEQEQHRGDCGPDQEAVDEILDGLSAAPRKINPKYFYDEHGSQLFDAITRLEEYYPTRTERAMLEQLSDEIAAETGKGRVLVEPGAGGCDKVRLLLDALAPACYIPIDISREYLFEAAGQLQHEFPHIPVRPVAGDMQASLILPPGLEDIPRLVFYPGSTIGNYTPTEAVGFLRHIRSLIGDDGGFLVGVDLHKDVGLLNAAYNDAAGVTAAFNLNMLSHINALTGADFELAGFRHIAFYNEREQRIEMYLESQSEQVVSLGGRQIPFAAGERILSEYSYKYTVAGFAQLAAGAGLYPARHWVDAEDLFSIQYYTSKRTDR